MNFDASQLWGESCRRGGTRRETRTGVERLSSEREEEGDGLALSEARLCVNVWLAFGRQPWQIALLGWQPGSLSSSQLAPQDRHSSWLYALFSPPPLVLLHSTSSSSFSTRLVEDNVTSRLDEWMNGDARCGRAVLFWNRTDQPGAPMRSREPIPTHGVITYVSFQHCRKAYARSLSFLPPIAIFIINLDLSVEA